MVIDRYEDDKIAQDEQVFLLSQSSTFGLKDWKDRCKTIAYSLFLTYLHNFIERSLDL